MGMMPSSECSLRQRKVVPWPARSGWTPRAERGRGRLLSGCHGCVELLRLQGDGFSEDGGFGIAGQH